MTFETRGRFTMDSRIRLYDYFEIHGCTTYSRLHKKFEHACKMIRAGLCSLCFGLGLEDGHVPTVWPLLGGSWDLVALTAGPTPYS